MKKIIICTLVFLLLVSTFALAFEATRTINGNTISIQVNPQWTAVTTPSYVIKETVVGATITVIPDNADCGLSGQVLTCNYKKKDSVTLVYTTTGSGSVSGTITGKNNPATPSSTIPIAGDTAIPKAPSCTPKTATCAATGIACPGNTVINKIDCPSGQTCKDDETQVGDQSACVAACTPKTCASQKFNCGTINDGCGNTLTCGTCTAAGYICTNNLCTESSPAKLSVVKAVDTPVSKEITAGSNADLLKVSVTSTSGTSTINEITLVYDGAVNNIANAVVYDGTNILGSVPAWKVNPQMTIKLNVPLSLAVGQTKTLLVKADIPVDANDQDFVSLGLKIGTGGVIYGNEMTIINVEEAPLPPAKETICDDGKDNDLDGNFDCTDHDCDGLLCGDHAFCQSNLQCGCGEGYSLKPGETSCTLTSATTKTIGQVIDEQLTESERTATTPTLGLLSHIAQILKGWFGG